MTQFTMILPVCEIDHSVRPSTSTECWLQSHFRVGIKIIGLTECIVKRLFVSLIAVLVTTPAFAEDFYVGAGFGFYSYEEPGIEISESTIGAYAGWKILPNLAVEGQWIQWSGGYDSIFEPATGTSIILGINSFDTLALYAKPSLTVSEGFDVYAKLSFASLSGDIEVTYISPVGCGFAVCTDVETFTDKSSDTDLIWGVGGEYNMPNGFGLRAEVVGFEVADERAFTYLLSAHYKFN